MKVKVIEEQCIACGACGAICPEVFEVDGVSKVINDNISDDLKETVEEAIETPVIPAPIINISVFKFSFIDSKSFKLLSFCHILFSIIKSPILWW